MTNLERELIALKEAQTFPEPQEEAVQRTVKQSQCNFYVNQATELPSYFDFLHAQAVIMQKRWWMIQAGILIVLWVLMNSLTVERDIQLMTAATMPLFVIVAIPELWKNLRHGATEVENTSYFTLRQIYAARLVLFAGADLLLLTIFCGTAVVYGDFTLMDVISQFLIPCTVTCCICFQVLCSRKYHSEPLAVTLCLLWTALWSRLVLEHHIYDQLSGPVWAGLLLLSVAYLGFCIHRTLKNSNKLIEVTTWNYN